MQPETYSHLLTHFRSPTRELATFLAKDLSHWDQRSRAFRNSGDRQRRYGQKRQNRLPGTPMEDRFDRSLDGDSSPCEDSSAALGWLSAGAIDSPCGADIFPSWPSDASIGYGSGKGGLT